MKKTLDQMVAERRAQLHQDTRCHAIQHMSAEQYTASVKVDFMAVLERSFARNRRAA